jgi:hypothetical protein
MPKIAFLLFIVLDLGLPFYFGFVGGGLLVPLACSAGMAIFAIGTGWRAPVKGIVTSALIGMCFAMALNVPIYFIGRWLGHPTSQPIAFTTTELIVGLLVIGSASLDAWRRRQATPNTIKPFYTNATREERREWFAHTRPWNRITSTVIDAILDGITDKVILEVFVKASMEYGLVARYEPLGREGFDSPEVIRAQISQILCETGNPAVLSLAQALEAKQTDAAKKALMVAVDTFEPAVALAKNQIAAYAGMSAVCGLVGKSSESHDWAKRGLAELAEMRAEMRRLNLSGHESAFIHPDGLDQMERQLRSYLEKRGTSNNQSSRKPGTPQEVEAVFKKLDRLMEDEKAQTDGLPEPFRSKVLGGDDCDEIAGAGGAFGRDPRNPIPVNGQLGEMIYLSNLRTASSQQIMFHRLGSVGNVDVFETVSLDGAIWDVLFLDLYHPRKSRRAPTGYRIAIGAEREKLLLGSNEFVSAFPDQLQDAIANTYERLLGGRMRPPQVREAVERIKFKRWVDHEAKLNSIIATILKAKVPSTPRPESRRTAEQQKQNERQITHDEKIGAFISINEKLFTVQLSPKFQSPHDAFSSIITNKKAAGYVFGFHDAFAHWSGLMDRNNSAPGLDLIETSYKKLFGDWGGTALFNMSMSFQEDADFHKGRLIGGNELAEFMGG